MPIKTYRELDVWRRSMDLVEAVYELTSQFPSQERYGLCSQLQRAAVSIAANIAEGYGRLHRGEYIHHLSMARGSLFEVETLLTIAARIQLASRQQSVTVWKLSQQVGQMLHKLIVALRQSESRIPEPGTRGSNTAQ